MRVNQCFCTHDKAEILKAIEPLYEHAKVNKELFKKTLKVRNCKFNDEGYVRWDFSLISKNRPKLSEKEREMLETMDLRKKLIKLLDKYENLSALFCIKITAYSDGFQLNLDVKKDSVNEAEEPSTLDSISYFIWKAF